MSTILCTICRPCVFLQSHQFFSPQNLQFQCWLPQAIHIELKQLHACTQIREDCDILHTVIQYFVALQFNLSCFHRQFFHGQLEHKTTNTITTRTTQKKHCIINWLLITHIVDKICCWVQGLHHCQPRQNLHFYPTRKQSIKRYMQ